MPRPIAFLLPLRRFCGLFLLSGCILVPLPEDQAARMPLSLKLSVGSAPSPNASAPAPPLAPEPMPCAPASGLVGDAAAVLAGANALRARSGLPALRPSAALTRAAEVQACDNAARNLLSHFGADGAPLLLRVQRSGYAPRAVAENVGLGAVSGPDQILSAWMASPGHRANLLNPTMIEAGFGMASGAQPARQPAWVLVLAAPQ